MRILLISLMVVLLAACGPIYKTTYDFKPPKSQSGKMCLMQCEQSKMLCQQSCDLKSEACKADAQRDAEFQYADYRQAQQAQGKPVERTLSDFYNPWQCDTGSCGCEANYRSCYSICGGVVTANQQCVAFCGKGAQ